MIHNFMTFFFCSRLRFFLFIRLIKWCVFAERASCSNPWFSFQLFGNKRMCVTVKKNKYMIEVNNQLIQWNLRKFTTRWRKLDKIWKKRNGIFRSNSRSKTRLEVYYDILGGELMERYIWTNSRWYYFIGLSICSVIVNWSVTARVRPA